MLLAPPSRRDLSHVPAEIPPIDGSTLAPSCPVTAAPPPVGGGGTSARQRRARCSCTERIAAEPSPTAAATRLVDPERRSPTANRPGQLVSYGSGSATHRAPRVAEHVVVEGTVGEHEAVLVDGDAVEPGAVGLGTDEREQRGAVDVDLLVGAA